MGVGVGVGEGGGVVGVGGWACAGPPSTVLGCCWLVIVVAQVNEAPAPASFSLSVAENVAQFTTLYASIPSNDPEGGTMAYTIQDGNQGGRCAGACVVLCCVVLCCVVLCSAV